MPFLVATDGRPIPGAFGDMMPKKKAPSRSATRLTAAELAAPHNPIVVHSGDIFVDAVRRLRAAATTLGVEGVARHIDLPYATVSRAHRGFSPGAELINRVLKAWP